MSVKHHFRLAILSVLLVCALGAVAVASEYHAILQFSGEQGLDQWFYQYWDGNEYHDMTYNPEENRWEGPQSYLHIHDHRVHPGDSFAAVRKWVAPRAGSIYIAGHVRKGDPSTGDGIIARVLHNDKVLFEEHVEYDDLFGYFLDITVTVEQGDAIYFVTLPGETNSADATTWEEQIIYMPSR